MLTSFRLKLSLPQGSGDGIFGTGTNQINSIGGFDMKNKFFTVLIGAFAILALTFAFSTDSFAKTRVIFGGGPAGGTFQVVANGIQVYKPIKAETEFSVKAQTSAGSVENLRKTNAGRQQMSVVYSGHVLLGRNGQMKNDTKKYENVRLEITKNED